MGTTSLGITYPENSDFHPSQAWWKTLATTTDAAIANAKGDAVAGDAILEGMLAEQQVEIDASLKHLGTVPAGQDLRKLVTPGIYDMPSVALMDGYINGPRQQGDLDNPQPGTFIVRRTTNSLVSQTLYSYGGSGIWVVGAANTAHTAWTRWYQAAADRLAGIIPAESNVLSYSGGLLRGDWLVTAEAAATITNLPEQLPGLLSVLSPRSDMAMLVFRSFEAKSRTWSITRAIPNPWNAWELEGGGGASAGTDTNRLLVEAATRRRGGRRGTSGVGVINMRYDHNIAAFKAKVLPLHAARSMPATLALPADVLDPGYSRDDHTTVTWPEVQTWFHNHGIEPAWHSKTHQPADSPAAWESEIAEGYNKLAANLPQCKIEVGLQIGTTGSMWGGMLPIDSPQKLHGTAAGRLLLSTVPISSGHMGGYFRPLTGQIQQGLAHETIERLSDYPDAASIIALIQEAQDTASGLSLMLHPNMLDTTGYITTSTLAAVLDYLEAERDAGRVEVLTYSGMSVSDASTSYQHDLLVDGGFKSGLTKWTGTGWTTSTSSGKTWALSPSDTTGLRQDLRFTRRYGLSGCPRELVVRVKADAATVVRLNVRDTSSYSTMNATKDFAIGAGEERTIRLPVGVPYSATGYPSMTIRTEISRISGGRFSITDARMTVA